MECKKLRLVKVDNKRGQPRTSALSDLDYWKLFVAARLQKRSVASMVREAIVLYLFVFWSDFEQRLEVEATRNAIEVEEMFERLCNDGAETENDEMRDL